MLIKYDVINATQEENNIVNTILQYIYDNYSERLCFDRLKRLEVIDELVLTSGEINHLASGENDQSQPNRNDQCTSFSFL